ncbi:hypothetical protein [Streptomyces sp. NPDC001985]|uniref:hypothetical protein n=1 Tax=Streptomyces sp. NPDC001985 TaxID=3154406 RepID=UPI003317A72C
MTDARSPLRALRALLFAAICISLATLGHTLVSGHDIPLTPLLPAFPLISALAWLAAARRRGALTIGLGLLAVQGALHLYFARAQLHGAPEPAHHHTPDPTPDLGLLGPSPVAMVAAHLLSAAVCAVWLARGEAAFLRLARAVAALAFTPLRLLLAVVRPLPDPAPRPVRRRPARARRRSLLLADSLVRRGPPAPLAPRATAPGAAV